MFGARMFGDPGTSSKAMVLAAAVFMLVANKINVCNGEVFTLPYGSWRALVEISGIMSNFLPRLGSTPGTRTDWLETYWGVQYSRSSFDWPRWRFWSVFSFGKCAVRMPPAARGPLSPRVSPAG